MNKNLSLLLSGIVSLPVIKSIAGSRSLTYDFSMLEERQFNDRRIARYKKKFPRMRVISKYCPDFDLCVFYLPETSVNPGREKEWNDEKILKHYIPDAIFSETDLKTLNVAKRIAKTDKNCKILIVGLQNQNEQITPYLMLHMLGESAIAGDWSYHPNPEHLSHCKEYYGLPKQNIFMKYHGDFYNCILPNDKNISRWLIRYQKNLNTKGNPLFTGYGLSPNEMLLEDSPEEPTQLWSDCIAQLLSKGTISWLTPENCEPLKFMLNHKYSGHTLPNSYDPLKCNILEKVEGTFMPEIISNQIFFA